MMDRVRRVETGSHHSVHATAESAAAWKLSAASLGYFKDSFLLLLVGAPSPGHVRRLPPTMNMGEIRNLRQIHGHAMDEEALEMIAPRITHLDLLSITQSQGRKC